jgi:hypothetical protein
MIKSRRIRWAGRVVRINEYKILVRNLEGRDHLGKIGEEGRIIRIIIIVIMLMRIS